MMTVLAAVLRRGRVWKYLVKGHVVEIHIVADGTQNVWRRGARIADQSCQGNVDHIIAEATAIGPAARNNAAVVGLDSADKRVTTEET